MHSAEIPELPVLTSKDWEQLRKAADRIYWNTLAQKATKPRRRRRKPDDEMAFAE